jgi:hypothetical protein
VTPPDPKSSLRRYLDQSREAVVWKLDGLSEYDVRRPLTRTGTNLLGLVKHLTIGEAWYFGRVFDRPFAEQLPWWDDDAEDNVDMWVTPEESRADVVDRYHRAIAHADATIEQLPLDALGRVPWWGESGEVTLHQVLVHVTAETHRHAGHADILREQLDGSVGRNAGNRNVADLDDDAWAAHVARVEQAARDASA